ncbi:oligosaccharide flippase family protein [Flavobacterium ovatum]|uniref:lipopolysaccharide biosynthesis protein n=1 Tax=Flavobacterium ovatum TaxID=1928857 RepID=UPI00344D33C6
MNKNKLYHFSQNLVSLFTVKGLDLALTLGLIPYLILKVGIANYGTYAFAMALMLFFVNVLNYGFDLAVVRELAKNKDNTAKINQLFNEVFSVKLFLLLLVYLVLFILVFFVPKFKDGNVLYFSASLLLLGDLFSLRWFFLGLEKMKFITLISFFSTIIYVSLVLLLVNEKNDFIWIPFSEAIGLFVISGIAFVWVVKEFKITIQLLSIKKITDYLRLHFNAYVNLLLPSTTGVLIVFLVGVFGMPYAVALTQVGVKVTSAFATVNTVLTTVFYPMVNREKKNMPPTRYVLLGIGFCLSILMYLGSPFLISNWLHLEQEIDVEYTVQIVQILSPIPFLMGVISSYGINGLLVYLKDKLYRRITVSTTFFIVLSSFFLIPKFPVLGGAITFVIGRALYALLSFYHFNKIVRLEKQHDGNSK